MTKETFQFFHSSLWVTWFLLHYLKIQQPPYLFLISFQQRYLCHIQTPPPAEPRKVHDVSMGGHQDNSGGFFSLPPRLRQRASLPAQVWRVSLHPAREVRCSASGLGSLEWTRLVHFPCRLANCACWSEWPTRSLQGLGLANDGINLFPGPQEGCSEVDQRRPQNMAQLLRSSSK